MRNGWLTTTLGDIADVRGGKRVPKGYKLLSDPTGYPYLTVSDFTDDGTVDLAGLRYISKEVFEQIKRYTISSADIFLSIAGTIGKTGYVPRELDGASLTENACKLVLRPGIDRDFVYYFTKSDAFLRQAETNTRVAAQPKLALERLKTIRLSVPTSLLEQQRIVGLLDEAFAGVATARANTDRNRQNARALFDSHLHSVFTDRGSKWVRRTLGDFCSFENGDRGSNYPSKSVRSATGIPFINAGHLTDDGIDLETMDYIPRERFDLLSNGKIRNGDILFCLRGSLGKFASVGDLNQGAIASSLVIVRPDETVLKQYLVAYFRSSLCSDMIKRFENGAAQPNLSVRNLREFIAPVPRLEEQELVVRELEAIREQTQRLGDLYERKLAALEAFKKSLLHQAFSGEL